MPDGNSTVFEKLETGTNINLYHFHTRKFKSVTIKVFFTGVLDRDIEAKAILPFILKRGSREFPSLAAISQELERLFGTRLVLDVHKLGERQMMVAILDMVNERLIPGGASVFEAGLRLLRDVLTRPLCEAEGFVTNLFDSEKRNLERFIRSQINDKATYANIRLVEEMFKDRPFGRYHWGQPDGVQALDPVATFAAFRRFISTAPIDLYVMGDLSGEQAGEIFRSLFGGAERGQEATIPEDSGPAPGAGEIIEEEQPVEQSKLAMGFNVANDCDDATYYALFFYNAILGGGSYSKLFKNVREKESLAYYAHSAYDKIKGFLKVVAGIHRDNFGKATEIVRQQMEEIAAGRISDEEFGSAKKALLNVIRSVLDSPAQMIDYHKVALLGGREIRIERIEERIAKIQPDDVVAAAGLVTPGKTFFLKGTAG